MLYMVCYDISDDKTRNQMSERLLDFGVRIQESVFECVLDGYGYVRMMEALNKVPIEDSDRLRIYKVCQTCVEAIQIYGPGEITSDPEYYVV